MFVCFEQFVNAANKKSEKQDQRGQFYKIGELDGNKKEDIAVDHVEKFHGMLENIKVALLGQDNIF